MRAKEFIAEAKYTPKNLKHPDPKIQKDIEEYFRISELPRDEFMKEYNKDPERLENARQAFNNLHREQSNKDEKARLDKVGFVQMPKEYKGPAIPKVVYHGTMRNNLPSIMKDGLKPKLNKWLWLNRWQGQHPSNPKYIPPTPEEKIRDTTLSVADDIETALAWAVTGGGRGERTPESEKGAVVLAFQPLPTDKVDGEGMSGELVFRNVISPNRLKIVYPERLKGKEKEYLEKGAGLTDFNTEKSNKMKQINKQLKQAGSPYRIKTFRYAKPRWDVFGVDNRTNRKPEDWPATQDPSGSSVIPLNSPEFQAWLKKQLTNS